MENFEELLQKELDKLPYTKHLDDGQYNDGQVAGFELGARWALSLFAVSGRSEQLCGFFEADTKTSSATKCKCGREKWEHPKAT
jgi:hypothetical protein